MTIHVPLIINDIRERLIHRNKNWLCMIIGETGSGKSYCALRIAELIDPNFPPDCCRVYFSVKAMITDMKNGLLKKGDVAILDETGVSFSSRKWWSMENRNFGFLLQAVRHRNFAIIFCLPSSSMMDKTGRILMHTIVQTMNISYRDKYVSVKWKNSKWDDINMRMNYRYPVVTNPDGTRVRLTQMHIQYPSNKLMVENYEKKKGEFTQMLMEEAEKQIDAKDRPKKVRPMGEKRAMIETMLKEGKLKPAQIAKATGATRTYVSIIRGEMK